MIPPWPGQPRHAGEGGARVGGVVQDPRAIDHVEGAAPQSGAAQVGLDELHPRAFRIGQPEPPRRRGAQLQGRAGKVGPDHQPVGLGEVETHLAGAAADLDDAGVAGDGLVEQAGEFAALGPGAQGAQGLAGAIAGKGRPLIEQPHRLGAPITADPQVRHAVGRLVAGPARGAAPVRRQDALARRTGDQVPQGRHGAQKMA